MRLTDTRLSGSILAEGSHQTDFRKEYEDLSWTRILDRSEIPSGNQVIYKMWHDLEEDKRK